METSFTSSIEPYQNSLVIIPKDEIDFRETLGEGNFGIVKKCLLKQQNIECACKTLKDSNKIKTFSEIQTEINNMVKLRDHNIVALYGIVNDGERIWIVTEFCGGGPLINRLLDKKKPKLLVTILIDYAKQAASGMNYLSQKKIVHRDLATRNVLLMIDEKTIKIADFGLARIIKDDEEYYKVQSNPAIPVGCTAPECFKIKKWSTSSDVWSYGIMLIEMFSYGECIRGIVSVMMNFFQDRINLAQIVKNGDAFKRPNACPPKIYKLMQKCLEIDPMERPNFGNIKTSLSNYRLSISEVTVNINSYYNSGVDGNRNEYLSVKKDDCVVVINDLDVDRVYCQDLKTHDFGYVSTHILNAINENFNNFRTQNELKENPGDVDTYITPIPNYTNRYSGTPIRQNSFPNSISQISYNPEIPLLKPEELEFISCSSYNFKPIWEKLWEKSQIKKISIAIFLILFLICVIIIVIYMKRSNPFLPLAIEPCLNQTFIQGESVKIRCWVLPFKKFNDLIQIEWSIKDDNHFLDGAKNQNGTLVFSSIGEDDTGCYTCQAWDLETDLTASQTICLQVDKNPNKPQGNYKTIKHKIDHDMEGPKHVSISPSNGLSTDKNPLKAGSNDSLWCGSLNEDPLQSAEYTHKDNGVNTVYRLNDTVFIENHKAILNFSNNLLKDIKTGNYQCYIERQNKLDHEGDQFVYIRPFFHFKDQDAWIPYKSEPFEIAKTIEVSKTETARMPCPVYGGPDLKVQWQFWEDPCFKTIEVNETKTARMPCPVYRGSDLKVKWQSWQEPCLIEAKFEKRVNTLIISNVKKQYEGFYRCMVEGMEWHSNSPLPNKINASLTYHLRVK